jgi:hypothetical protein
MNPMIYLGTLLQSLHPFGIFSLLLLRSSISDAQIAAGQRIGTHPSTFRTTAPAWVSTKRHLRSYEVGGVRAALDLIL